MKPTLTAVQQKQVARLYATNNLSQRDLAIRFGTTQTVIKHCVRKILGREAVTALLSQKRRLIYSKTKDQADQRAEAILKAGDKRCSKCHKTQPLDCYRKNPGSRTALHWQCRTCEAIYTASRSALNVQRAADWKAKNMGRFLVNQKRYFRENKERLKERGRAWRRANPEKKVLYEHRRRVRLLGNGGNYTTQEWLDRLAEFQHRCAYCRRRRRLTVEHLVPISRGGSNDIENIVPACGTCNAKKGNKLPLEFIVFRL